MEEFDLKWFEEMYTIRRCEELISQLYSLEIFRCPVHLAVGHEGSAVGVISSLENSDIVLSYHRSHHHYLAKGGNLQMLIYELLGDNRGCSGGKGGSTHLYAPEVNFMGSTAIIAGVLPVATGYAHGLKLQKKKNLVTCFIGDAAIEEGVFFESLNIASNWKLPLMLVIEDNDISCYTPKVTRQAIKNYSKISSLFDIDYDEVDGSNINEVYKKAMLISTKVRNQSKPAILKVNVFRAHEHCGPDQDNYLSYRKIKGVWPELDPLLILGSKLDVRKKLIIEKKIDSYLENEFNFILKEKGINANL